ncbi:MAG: hypothetical protein IJG65_05525 [Synergistaceae bacterium]|nr:hypothetical protein [Synergistaceae bacterium]
MSVGIKGGLRPEWRAETCTHCGKCVNSRPMRSFEGVEGYIVSFGGTFGNRIAQGEVIIPFIKKEETQRMSFLPV